MNDVLLSVLAIMSWVALAPLLTRLISIMNIYKTMPQKVGQKLVVTALLVAVVVFLAVWSTLAVLT